MIFKLFQEIFWIFFLNSKIKINKYLRNNENHQKLKVFKEIHFVKNSRLYRTFEFYTNNLKDFYSSSILSCLIKSGFGNFLMRYLSLFFLFRLRLCGIFLIKCFQTLDLIKAIGFSVEFNYYEYEGKLIH